MDHNRKTLGCTAAHLRRVALGAAMTAIAMSCSFAGSSAFAQAGFEVHLAQGTAREVRLPAGQAATVRTNGEIGDIRIADPKVAEVAPLDTDSLYLLGVAPGRTTVTVYDPEKRPIGVLQVEVGVDVIDLKRAIHQHVPSADISVTTVNGRLRLGGSVPNGEALATVLDLANQYDPTAKFINAIRVEEAQQVLLEVRFVEASRSAGKELGINVSARQSNVAGRGLYTGDTGMPVNSNGQYIPGVTYPNAGRTTENAYTFPATGNAAFGTLIATVLSSGINIDVFVRALEQRGLGRSLAEPNLTALSGETATFLAGGQIPIPITGNEGEVTIEYKDYGVKLSFTPVVLDDGIINLKLEPEVSQIDRSVTVFGAPGLTTRRTKTTVELRDGQSFAISGLLLASTEKQQDQLPYVGNVPVLGALFRSSSFIKRETDLVVIVTPRIVRPAKPGEVLPDPLTGSRNSNDIEFFLAGLMEVDDSTMKKIRNGYGIEGAYGHILELTPPAPTGPLAIAPIAPVVPIAPAKPVYKK